MHCCIHIGRTDDQNFTISTVRHDVRLYPHREVDYSNCLKLANVYIILRRNGIRRSITGNLYHRALASSRKSCLKTSGVASPKIWEAKMFDIRRITSFYLEKRLSKHRMTMFSKNLVGGHGPSAPLATPMLMTI